MGEILIAIGFFIIGSIFGAGIAANYVAKNIKEVLNKRFVVYEI